MSEKLSVQDRVFVLTGAGVSAESGLPTFRGVNGLWRGYRVEDVATPEAFAADPELVWQFYSERRQRHQTVAPNPAHFALAELELALADRMFLCTQNVDSLHEQAGSRRVVHMHGRIMQSRCSNPRVQHCAVRGSQPLSHTPGNSHVPGMRRADPAAHLLVWRSSVRDGPSLAPAWTQLQSLSWSVVRESSNRRRASSGWRGTIAPARFT